MSASLLPTAAGGFTEITHIAQGVSMSPSSRTEISEEVDESGPSKKQEEAVEEVRSDDLNIIMNLSCLQSLIDSSGALCPECKEPSLREVNKGSSALLDVMLELELVGGSTLGDFVLKEDTARVVKSSRKSSEKEKEKRKKIEMVRRMERQERQEREGEVYGPGQF
ncbi:uncharacterized protein LOC143274639 [Babylonia areolata]|uniref:uncharacterized protein LOC143274639 n=1 Tax=Babylonia areolata TaxID=304850 RepID=UPI003FD25748